MTDLLPSNMVKGEVLFGLYQDKSFTVRDTLDIHVAFPCVVLLILSNDDSEIKDELLEHGAKLSFIVVLELLQSITGETECSSILVQTKRTCLTFLCLCTSHSLG